METISPSQRKGTNPGVTQRIMLLGSVNFTGFQILLATYLKVNLLWPLSSVGRAPACLVGCQGFESPSGRHFY